MTSPLLSPASSGKSRGPPKRQRGYRSIYCAFTTNDDPSTFTRFDLLRKYHVDDFRWFHSSKEKNGDLLNYIVALRATNGQYESAWRLIMVALHGVQFDKWRFNRSSTPYLKYCCSDEQKKEWETNVLNLNNTQVPLDEEAEEQVDDEQVDEEEQANEEADEQIEKEAYSDQEMASDVDESPVLTWKERFPTLKDFLDSSYDESIDLLEVAKHYLGSELLTDSNHIHLQEWPTLVLHKSIVQELQGKRLDKDLVDYVYDIKHLVFNPVSLIVPLLVKHSALENSVEYRRISEKKKKKWLNEQMQSVMRERMDLVTRQNKRLEGLLRWLQEHRGDDCSNLTKGDVTISKDLAMEHLLDKFRLNQDEKWVTACLTLMSNQRKKMRHDCPKKKSK